MSVHVLSWVFSHSEAEAGERMVLLVLANYADEDGLSWPSVDRISREAKLDRRTVQRCIAKLVSTQQLVRVLNGAPDNRQRPDRKTNAYRILRGGTSDTPFGYGAASDAERGGVHDINGAAPRRPNRYLNRHEPRQVPQSLSHPPDERLLDRDEALVEVRKLAKKLRAE